jgi:hypothetical protein
MEAAVWKVHRSIATRSRGTDSSTVTACVEFLYNVKGSCTVPSCFNWHKL